MRPSVMTAVESTGSRPLARSTVSTVSRPRPEKPTGRRTSRHCTIACGFEAAWPARLMRYDGIQSARRDEVSTERLCAFAVASATGVAVCGCRNGSDSGIWAVETMRTVLPTMRAER